MAKIQIVQQDPAWRDANNGYILGKHRLEAVPFAIKTSIWRPISGGSAARFYLDIGKLCEKLFQSSLVMAPPHRLPALRIPGCGKPGVARHTI
jgi:hypothetical protein